MGKYYPPRYLFRRYEILQRVRPAALFLEIGAGELDLSRELLKIFPHGKAIDLSPETRSFYNKLDVETSSRLIFDVTDLINLQETNCYDCVISCEVMEHLEDDRTFLLEISRLLKPRGQVILSVPAHMKFWSIHDEITGHYRRYEKHELVSLLKDAGFENISIIAYGYPFINILRQLRVIYAAKQATQKVQWSKNQQTQCSGINHVSGKFHWLGLLINPCTVLPFNWLAKLFNKTDLSEGYIATANKRLG